MSEVFESKETHRLVPARFSDGGSVLDELGLPPEIAAELSEIDAATNDRKMAERGKSLGIGPGELLMGVPEVNIVNAAFCHPNPAGSRFNDASRGAWYAGVDIKTSIAEVAFHKRLFLENSRTKAFVDSEYQDFVADFAGDFHRLSSDEQGSCLKADPIPDCYRPGQALANVLLHAGSPGIVYASVRDLEGTCVACFRPAMVNNPRRGSRYVISVAAGFDHVGTRVIS